MNQENGSDSPPPPVPAPDAQMLSVKMRPAEAATTEVVIEFRRDLAMQMGEAIRAGMDAMQALAIFLQNIRIGGFSAQLKHGPPPPAGETPQIAVARAMPRIPPPRRLPPI